jgi:hypothetical protein
VADVLRAAPGQVGESGLAKAPRHKKGKHIPRTDGSHVGRVNFKEADLPQYKATVTPEELEEFFKKDEYLMWLRSLCLLSPKERIKEVVKRFDVAGKVVKKREAILELVRTIDRQKKRMMEKVQEAKSLTDEFDELGRLVILHRRAVASLNGLTWRLRSPPESRMPVINYRIEERQTYLTRLYITKKVALDRLRLRQKNAFWGPMPKKSRRKGTLNEPD